MKYSSALLFGSFMAACILIPVLVGIAFAFYAFGVSPQVASFALVAVSLLSAKLLSPRIREFAEPYR